MIHRIFFILIAFGYTQITFSQRCGYDYLQAFVVEIVDQNHQENIPHLKLTLTNEFGEKLEYPSHEYHPHDPIYERPQIPEKRLNLKFLKNNHRSNFQEFWENGNTRGLSHPNINQPAHLKLRENLYVIFVQFHYSRNEPKQLPAFQVLVEDPDSVNHFKQFPKRLFRLNPEKAVYLCVNDLIGDEKPILNLNRIYHLDGTKFEPIKFDLSQTSSNYQGKIEQPFYFNPVLKPVIQHSVPNKAREMMVESIDVYEGQNLRFLQKIIPQKFAKFAKFESNNLRNVDANKGVYPEFYKTKIVQPFQIKDSVSLKKGITISWVMAQTLSGVQLRHDFYMFFDSIKKQFVLDSILSEYPNVLLNQLPNRILRYQLIENEHVRKLIYFVLEEQNWVFYKEKILEDFKMTEKQKTSVWNQLEVIKSTGHEIKQFDIRPNGTLFDTLKIWNKGKSDVHVSKVNLNPGYNPYLFQVNRVVSPDKIKSNDTGLFILEILPQPNFQFNGNSLPFEYKDVNLEIEFNKSEKIPFKFKYLGLNGVQIQKKSASDKLRYDDRIREETITFVPHKGVSYTLTTENNAIIQYGKFIQEKDTQIRVGDWYFTNPRNFIQYSVELEFQVTANKKLVDSSLVVYAIKNGKMSQLKTKFANQWFSIWLPSKIDSIYFQWNNNYNIVSGISQNHYQSKYMVDLFPQTHKAIFPQKYNQFVVNTTYEFDPNVYLLKLKSNDYKNLDKIREAFILSYRGIKFQVDARHSKQYLLVDFEGYSYGERIKWLWKWIDRKEIESAHIGMLVGNSGINFLGKGLTIKPQQNLYGDNLEKLVKGYGFELNHNLGDGSYQIISQSAICNENLFENMLRVVQDKQFILASPEFFNPIMPLLD